jgi:hypothetical protein
MDDHKKAKEAQIALEFYNDISCTQLSSVLQHAIYNIIIPKHELFLIIRDKRYAPPALLLMNLLANVTFLLTCVSLVLTVLFA